MLGSDSRAGLTTNQQNQFGHSTANERSRSDTIMFVHLDIPSNHTTIVSIPRDLYVNIPGHGYDKINAAYSYGPGVLVKTVEQLTGMPINHYVAVDFAGFENLVGAIGGVPVCIQKPMIDPLAGLNLTHAGCYNLKGQAGARVRPVPPPPGRPHSGLLADHAPAGLLPRHAQQAETSASVIHLPALLKAIRHNVVIDQHLNVYDLQDLMHRMTVGGSVRRGLPRRVRRSRSSRTTSTTSARCSPRRASSSPGSRRTRRSHSLGQALPLTGMSPANVRVEVFDANSNGKAQDVATFLSKAGFHVVKVAPAPPNLFRNQVRWAPDMHLQRATLLQYIHGVHWVVGKTFGPGGVITIVVGPTFPQQK